MVLKTLRITLIRFVIAHSPSRNDLMDKDKLANIFYNYRKIHQESRKMSENSQLRIPKLQKRNSKKTFKGL